MLILMVQVVAVMIAVVLSVLVLLVSVLVAWRRSCSLVVICHC